MKVTITFEIDTDHLRSWTDSHLAALWHIAQANPAPIENLEAGRLAECIGREIIRRFVKSTGPELWHHQGEHHWWAKVALNRAAEAARLSEPGVAG